MTQPRSSIAAILFLLCATALTGLSGTANGAELGTKLGTRPLTPENFLDGTVRLRLRTTDGGFVRTGWGAAFAVDLSRYGLMSSRYLLTAAHLINTENGQIMPRGDLDVEVENNTWATCKVVAMDKNRDLCLLECSVRMPVLSKLSTGGDVKTVGDKIVVVGCPRGVPPCESRGMMTDFQPNVNGVRWQAAAQFNHGNSGGPVYSERTGAVIGVAVAGVSDGMGDMRPDIALFAPYTEIRNFLNLTMAARSVAQARRR